jgi:hypothetical protein
MDCWASSTGGGGVYNLTWPGYELHRCENLGSFIFSILLVTCEVCELIYSQTTSNYLVIPNTYYGYQRANSVMYVDNIVWKTYI